MTHRFGVGQQIKYQTKNGLVSGSGTYKVVRQMPIGDDNRLCYRIKSTSETFERVVEEHELSRTQ